MSVTKTWIWWTSHFLCTYYPLFCWIGIQISHISHQLPCLRLTWQLTRPMIRSKTLYYFLKPRTHDHGLQITMKVHQLHMVQARLSSLSLIRASIWNNIVPISISILKGLDGGKFSLKIKAQHGPYWWIFVNGCGMWTWHLMDIYCLHSHRWKTCPSYSTQHGSYVLMSNHYHQDHSGPAELSPLTMRQRILCVCIIVMPWTVLSCCSITLSLQTRLRFYPTGCSPLLSVTWGSTLNGWAVTALGSYR